MKKNLLNPIPAEPAQEVITPLMTAPNVRVERIVSFGQISPEGFWYEQSENEWIVLLEGSAQLRFADRSIDLSPGDYLNIPAGVKHRVEKTAVNSATIWLAVFYK